MRPRRVRSIASIGSSKRRVRTPCVRLHPGSRPGQAPCRDLGRFCLCRLCHRRLRGALSAGVSPARLTPVLCWTRWSRPCTSAGPCGAAASSIIVIAVCSTSRSGIPSGLPRRASSLRWAASGAASGAAQPVLGPAKPDPGDNALAETVNGLCKAELIHRRGPWRSFEAVEFATLEWVDWFNNRRLLEPIGNIPPAEAEAAYHAQIAGQAMAA